MVHAAVIVLCRIHEPVSVISSSLVLNPNERGQQACGMRAALDGMSDAGLPTRLVLAMQRI